MTSVGQRVPPVQVHSDVYSVLETDFRIGREALPRFRRTSRFALPIGNLFREML